MFLCTCKMIGDNFEYNLSPAIASTTLILGFAWSVSFVVPIINYNFESTFATLSNICFVGAGLYHEHRAPHRRGAVKLAGSLASSSLPLILIGVSSFAFHIASDVGSNAHTLDIFMGWVLVLHVATIPVVVAVASFVPTRFSKFVSRLVLSTGIVVALFLFASFYDGMYRNQKYFYLVSGSIAMAASALCRRLLMYDNNKLTFVPSALAFAELVVGVVVVISAVFSQGELLGRRVSLSSDARRYDIFHGQWHFLLATISSASYARAGDAANRLIVELERGSVRCICKWPVLDAVGGVAVLLHATFVILLKELDSDIVFVNIVLSVSTTVLFLHACVVVYHLLPTCQSTNRPDKFQSLPMFPVVTNLPLN